MILWLCLSEHDYKHGVFLQEAAWTWGFPFGNTTGPLDWCRCPRSFPSSECGKDDEATMTNHDTFKYLRICTKLVVYLCLLICSKMICFDVQLISSNFQYMHQVLFNYHMIWIKLDVLDQCIEWNPAMTGAAALWHFGSNRENPLDEPGNVASYEVAALLGHRAGCWFCAGTLW